MKSSMISERPHETQSAVLFDIDRDIDRVFAMSQQAFDIGLEEDIQGP